MPRIEQGSGNEKVPNTVSRIKKAVVFIGEAARGLGTAVRDIPRTLQAGETQKDRDARTRREYKFAVLKPYIEQLPNEVLRVALDHDTFLYEDRSGRRYGSEYQNKLASGEVQRVIQEGIHPVK